MTGPTTADARVELHPATVERWPDLERLFGPRGACGGCWCMHWRRRAAEYEAGKGEENRALLESRVAAGDPPPGVLAYVDGTVAGWCSVGPRPEFVRLEASRILAPVDDRSVWSVVCFFVAREHRDAGLSRRLLEGAVALARDHGAALVEGYPVDPRRERTPPVFAFTGLASAFEAAGFEVVARRSPTRPVMRRRCRP